MSRLHDLVINELRDRNSARVDIQILLDALGEQRHYTRLAGGLFVPDIGVIGQWSPEEKQAVKNIIHSRNQENTLGHIVGRALTGHDDPDVARHRTAYEVIEKMRAGDLARVYVEESQYLLAAFPANPPASSLVLFVK